MKISWTKFVCMFVLVMLFSKGQAQTFNGTFKTADDLPINNVTVTTQDNNSNTETTQTDAQGDYVIDAISGVVNKINGVKVDANPLNGVSTLDLFYMRQHILYIQLLDSPYKVAAGDINRSGQITTFDLVHIMRAVLGNPVNVDFLDWRFVPSSYDFPTNGVTYNISSYPESILYDPTTYSGTLDFIGFKPGDVDCSADPSQLIALEDGQTRSEQQMDLVLSGGDFRAGDVQTLSLKTSDKSWVAGMQFTLEFDPEVVSFEGVASESVLNIGEDNLGLTEVDDGKILIAWFGDGLLELNPNDELINFSFKGKADANLADVIKFDSDHRLVPEIYPADPNNSIIRPEVFRLGLEYETTTSNNRVLTQDLKLRNEPNPFINQTQISLVLPKSDNLTLQLYNVNGELVYSQQYDLAEGFHSLPVSGKVFPSAGIYIAKLTTSEGFGTIKIQHKK